MAWAIAGAVLLLLLVKSTALATMTQGGSAITTDRIAQLAAAIGQIEGNAGGNLGIRNGQSTTAAGLQAFLTTAFVNGGSTYYDSTMSFRALAWTWVCGPLAWNNGDTDSSLCSSGDNPDTWASFVAGQLGVSVNDSVGSFLYGV